MVYEDLYAPRGEGMSFNSILDEEPPFNPKYGSYFSYSKVPVSDDFTSTHFPSERTSSSNLTLFQSICRYLILSVTALIILCTLPFSLYFCLKRVKALERCIIFRLGQRLPLKGPGLVITFPCFDVVHIIDLSPKNVNIVESNQMLCSDGSVVEIRDFNVSAAVFDAIKSFTQMQDSDKNVEQFIKLSFSNLVASTHVEDLENKADWILRTFISNCNMYINNWGWEVNFTSLPKISVVSRADPVNPLMDALKSYFNPSSSGSSSVGGGIADLMGGSGLIPSVQPTSCHEMKSHKLQDTNDPFLVPLQAMAGRYMSATRMLGLDAVIISVEICEDGSKHFYKFNSGSIDIEKLEPMNVNLLDVKVTVRAGTGSEFLEFLKTGDSSKVTIENTLF